MVAQKIGRFLFLAGHRCLERDEIKQNFDVALLNHVILLSSSSSSSTVKFSEKTYLDLWSSIKTNIISTWQGNGKIPKYVFPSLLDLINLYFEEKNSLVKPDRLFSSRLLDWISLLRGADTQDTFCLYGQLIRVNEQSIYFIEIIINALCNPQRNIDDQILGLVRWLCDYDASLISSREELLPLYKEVKVGAGFSIEVLRDEYFPRLLASTSSGRVRSGVELLSTHLQHKTTWDDDIVAALAEVYRLRWSEMLDNDGVDDYLRLQEGLNQSWIRLAELLSGAGRLALFNGNHYRLLMPTLKYDRDLVQKDSITYYPLSHYILSDNTTYLILLDNCVSQFEAKNLFFNCNTRIPKPLTEKELSRLNFAGPTFRRYISFAKDGARMADPPISLNTVLEIKALIDASFYPYALQYGHTYNPVQLQIAGRGFHLFYNFLNRLSQQERDRLDKQRMIVSEQHSTFYELFDVVGKDDEDGCIADCGRFLTQLVLDYDPTIKFNKDVEARAIIPFKMRENSRKKTYSEYEALSDEEAKNRLLVLIVSIMSQSQNFSLDGETVYLWDCSKKIVGERKEIYILILPMIVSNDFKYARHVYATIMESIVKPALQNRSESWFAWVKIGYEKQQWLESVADESIFKGAQSWFNPERLLSSLFGLAQTNSRLYGLVEQFLDELVHTYTQNQSDIFKELRVNIKFLELLNQMDTATRREILDILAIAHQGPYEENLSGLFNRFMSHRVASAGCIGRGVGWSSLFFGQALSSHQEKINELVEPLFNYDFLRRPKSSNLMTIITSVMSRIEHLTCNETIKLNIRRYLEWVQHPIFPEPAERASGQMVIIDRERLSPVTR